MNKDVANDSILHRIKGKCFTPQELEIMSIFTSPKWSEKTYHGRHNIVNMVEKKEIQSNEKLINIKSNESEDSKESDFYPKNTNQQKYSVSENKNIFKKSGDSSQLLLRKEKKLQNNVENSNKNRNNFDEFLEVHRFTHNMSKNVSSKTMKIAEKSGSKLTSNKYFITEDFVLENEKPPKKMKNKNLDVKLTNADKSYRILSKEQGTSEKRESASTFLLSSKGSNKAFINTDLDDINDCYNSEIVDSSSTCSLNIATITPYIKNQAESCDLTTKRLSEKLAMNEAVKLIMVKAKTSLGKYLVEGLYEVSRNYRHDPFTSLGKWLLTQADIRDEYKIEQESYENNENLINEKCQ